MMNEQIKQMCEQVGIFQPERFDTVDGNNQLVHLVELVAMRCASAIREELKKFPECDLSWRCAMEAAAVVAEKRISVVNQ